MNWTRQGGFRSALIARLTRGRIGLGRWTQAEVDKIKAEAKRKAEEMADVWE